MKRKPSQPDHPPPTKKQATVGPGVAQPLTPDWQKQTANVAAKKPRLKPTPKRHADTKAEPMVVDLTGQAKVANVKGSAADCLRPKAKAMPGAVPANSFVDEAAWRLVLPCSSSESTSSSLADTLPTSVTPELTAAEAAEVVKELVENTDLHADTMLQELTAEWEEEGGTKQPRVGGEGKRRPRGKKCRAGKIIQFIRLKNLLKQIRDSAEEAMRS